MTSQREPQRVFSVLLHHPAVQALAAAAAREGVEVHLVGGILRDRMLGLPSHDLDAVVERRGEAVARRLGESLSARLVRLGGKEFGAWRLVAQDLTVDLWDREGTSLAADLARRDFTVNAIALTLPEGRVVDPHDGLADLAGRCLRRVSLESFSGDPLRVLRLPRLAAQLPGFRASPDTLAAAHRAAPALVGVAAERVREELDRIFRHPEAPRSLGILDALDLYPGLWRGTPGEAGATPVQGHASERARTAMGLLGRRAQSLREMLQREASNGRLENHSQGSPEAATTGTSEDRPASGRLRLRADHRLARFALSFFGLPEARSHPAGSPQRQAALRESLDRFTSAGYLVRRDAAAVQTLLEAPELPAEEVPQRRLLHHLGPLWGTGLCTAGARAVEPAAEARWHSRAGEILRLLHREGEEALIAPRPLLDGRQVGQLLGIPPGPALGEAVARLEQAQVDGAVRTPDEARRYLRQSR